MPIPAADEWATHHVVEGEGLTRTIDAQPKSGVVRLDVLLFCPCRKPNALPTIRIDAHDLCDHAEIRSACRTSRDEDGLLTAVFVARKTNAIAGGNSAQ